MLEELTKRRIFKTLAIYVALAWAVTEVLITVADRLGAPGWLGTAIVIVFIAGFPLATLFAWMYDIEDGKVRRVATARKGVMAGVLAAATIASAGASIVFYTNAFAPASRTVDPSIGGNLYGMNRPKPLTTMEGFEYDPALSPSGGHVAFVIQDTNRPVSHIYVKEVSGDNVVRLTDGEQLEKNPVWSPDGTQIAFIRAYERFGRHDIVVVPMLGGPERIIVSEHRAFMHIDWSPDGEQLAVEVLHESGGHIALFGIGSGTWTDVTVPKTKRGDRYPRFSPDGKYIAFVRLEDNFFGGSVCVQEIVADEPQCITPPDVELFVNHLAWLPDSKSLLVAAGETPGLQRLLNISVPDGAISVMPFGDDAMRVSVARNTGRLVFERYFLDHNIWRFPGPNARKGTEPNKLISSTWDELDSKYSPDGTRIAFQSSRSGGWEIWVANADGSSPRQVTNWGFANLPSWSPDSRSIGFTSRKYPTNEPEDSMMSALATKPMQAFIVDLAGGVPRRVSENDAYYSVAPSWSRDGRWIYYGRGPYAACGGEIWKVSTESREQAFLARCGIHALEGPGDRVFFERREGGFKLMSVSPDGGEPRLELDLSDMNCPTMEFKLGWTVWRNYFVYRDCSDFGVKMRHLGTGDTRLLADLSGDTLQAQEVQLSVSHDGEWILYNRLERTGSDLFLVEPAQ